MEKARVKKIRVKKTNKKWTAFILIISMITTLCMPIGSKAQNASVETVPEGYIGIYDIADLYGIRNDLSANYILMKDIDMSVDTAEGGEWNLTGHGWTPIDGFKGTLDGNGHRIIGMHIYGEMSRDVGLFGKMGDKATIENLALVDVDIDININVKDNEWAIGAIIGDGKGTFGSSVSIKIKRCYSSGNIIVQGECCVVGGMVGAGADVYDSYNACDVTVEEVSVGSVGGICGEGCRYDYYLGSSSFNNYSCCYNTGMLSRTDGGKTYSIANCNNYDNISNCYYLSGTANTNNDGCTVLFPTQLKDERPLVGFDFDSVWEIDPYCSYPYPQLKSNRHVRIASLELVSQPAKTEYEQGDKLEFSDGTVKIIYEDETTATIPITEDMVSGYDMNLIGEQKVKVSYCGVSISYPIIVKEVSLTGISLNRTEVSVERNNTFQLSVNYTPANASDKTVQWSTSDAAIAKVDDKGLVTAKNKGTAIITATSANGLTAQCEVEVLIPCAVITINKTSANMKVGDSLLLSAQMLPLDTTAALEWKTSNVKVADVADGVVTAYSAGTAKITAYVEGGVSAECKIIVENRNMNSSGNILNNNNSNKNHQSTNENNQKNVAVQNKIKAITSEKGKISAIESKNSTSIKVKLGKLKNADGYQVEYSLKKNFKKSKNIKKKSTNITIKKLKKSTKYYVRVRGYGKVNGKLYYGKWSTKKSIKTKSDIIYYGASHGQFEYEYTDWGIVSKISLKGNKMIIKGSLLKAVSEKDFYNYKGKLLKKATRTFKLDKSFKFYTIGGTNSIRKLSKKEGKRMCKAASGLELMFKEKDGKLVSLTFSS